MTKALLYELRRHVLKRDNYTCQKCGRVSEVGLYKEGMIKAIRRDSYMVDVYDWSTNSLLSRNEQIESSCGHDSLPARYVTWCRRCSEKDDIENFDIEKIDCPIHGEYSDECVNSGHIDNINSCKTVIWLNMSDLMTLKELGYFAKKPRRELVTEALHDLFDKYSEKEELR